MTKLSLTAYATASLMLFGAGLKADDFGKGVRPADGQMDNRMVFTDSAGSSRADFSHTLRGFTRGYPGAWGYITLRYSYFEMPKANGFGLGDITIGAGPTFRRDNLHAILSLESSLPTGDKVNGLSLTADRFVPQAFLGATYNFSPLYQLNLGIKRSLDGIVNAGQTDATQAGVLFGREMIPVKEKGKGAWLGVQLIGKSKDTGESDISGGVMSKVWLSKRSFIELGYRYGRDAQDMQYHQVETQLRFNLGK